MWEYEICVKCGVRSNTNNTKRPDYTSDLNDALRFIEKLIADGFFPEIKYWSYNQSWRVGFMFAVNGDNQWPWKFTRFILDASLSLAICKAGLLALGFGDELNGGKEEQNHTEAKTA